MNPRRGEVWLVDLGNPVGRQQSGTRPAVVVSADPLNDSRAGVVVVVPTTTSRRGLPSHVEIEPDGAGLDEVSYAKCKDVTSISEQRLIGRLGAVNEEVTFQIGRALRFLLSCRDVPGTEDNAGSPASVASVRCSGRSEDN